jgi:prevent-host-death family protein
MSADKALKDMATAATYNMHYAKTNLSRLVDQVVGGGEVFIAKAGKPVARLMPLASADAGKKRRLGLAAGKFKVPDDFDEPSPAEMWGDLLPRP